jgi:DNA-binding NtrC family response regulator
MAMSEAQKIRRILVADDEELMNDFLREILRRKGYVVDQALDGDSAIGMLKVNRYDLVIADKKMPGTDGIDVLKAIMCTQPRTPCIVMTAYGTVDGAVEAMKFGAFDYIMKPFEATQIENLVDKALRDTSQLRPSPEAPLHIVGRSSRMLEVFEMIQVVAPTSSTVMITGETGTGKELVAREIQRLSTRAERSFVRLNCAALPDGLIESELFGHERGAFTGAMRARKGKFEIADGGTILLDEIGEIGIHMQAKVLRVLQEKEFERIGAHQVRTVDVRVIATTNKNLEEEMAAGLFREDLFYRLNVFPIDLPPLRERKEDIPLLAEHFVQRYRKLCKTRITGVDDDALALLMKHDWPGNVRELENCLERAMIVGRGPAITKAEIVPPASLLKKEPLTLDPGTSLREMEKILVLTTLDSVGWNRTVAARTLGISTRTLRNKLKIYRAEEISDGAENKSRQTADGESVILSR